MKKIEKDWINVGYQMFAYNGLKELKVEPLAKKVNKNKSSFYHLFADLEVFMERLLDFHLKKAKIIAEKEAKAKTESELILVIIEHKIDLLFSRQLRIYRENPNFEKCFNKTNEISIPALLPVWKNIITLSENNALAQMVLHLSLENFYLQITDEILNEDWLKNYFKSIRQMVLHFKHININTEMNGSV